MSLAAINPVSDLRDYYKALKNCKDSEPVIFTKTGRGLYVVVTINQYEQLSAFTLKTAETQGELP